MKSFKTHRLDNNPVEKTFHDTFVNYFDCNGNINASQLSGVIFGWDVNAHPVPNEALTEREVDICLNFAQWLGSSVGQGFLFDCGFVPKKDNQDNINVTLTNESLIKKIYKADVVYIDGKTIKNKFSLPDIKISNALPPFEYFYYDIVSWEPNNKILHLRQVTKIGNSI